MSYTSSTSPAWLGCSLPRSIHAPPGDTPAGSDGRHSSSGRVSGGDFSDVFVNPGRAYASEIKWVLATPSLPKRGKLLNQPELTHTSPAILLVSVSVSGRFCKQWIKWTEVLLLPEMSWNELRKIFFCWRTLGGDSSKKVFFTIKWPTCCALLRSWNMTGRLFAQQWPASAPQTMETAAVRQDRFGYLARSLGISHIFLPAEVWSLRRYGLESVVSI